MDLLPEERRLSEFHPSFPLASGDAQTFAGAFLPVAVPPGMPPAELHDVPVAPGCWVRILLTRPPGPPRGAIVILHGIAGAASSRVVVRAAIEAWRRGWVAVRVNYRNCDGTASIASTLYNGGLSGDLAAVLASPPVRHLPGPRAAIGFSLGGNILLKYVGEASSHYADIDPPSLAGRSSEAFASDGPGKAGRALPHRGAGSRLAAAVAVCPPVDLLMTVERLERLRCAPYQVTFVRKLLAVARARHALAPSSLPAPSFRATPTLRSFDGRHTARDAGFSSAEEYYRLMSSAPLLPWIETPTLAIAASDDPLVPAATSLAPLRGQNPHLRVLVTAHGGHCGWIDRTGPGERGGRGRHSLLPAAALDFIERHACASTPRAETTPSRSTRGSGS